MTSAVTGKLPVILMLSGALVVGLVGCSSLGPSTQCTLGVQGTQTTLTYDGPGAQLACDQIRQNAKDTQFIATAQEPTSVPLVCDVAQGPIHVRVRDKGSLQSVATQLCQSLKQGLSPLGG